MAEDVSLTDLVSYNGKLLVPHPIPRLEDHFLSAVLHCLFNIFVDPPYQNIKSKTSIPWRHYLVTADEK